MKSNEERLEEFRQQQFEKEYKEWKHRKELEKENMPGEQFRTPYTQPSDEEIVAAQKKFMSNEPLKPFRVPYDKPLVSAIPQQDTGVQFDTGANREQSEQEYLDGPLWALKRIGNITFEGVQRYGPRNWRKGMPKNETFNHIMNHLLRWTEGDKSEDHLAKAAWGVMVLIVEEDIEAGVIER